MGIVIIVSAIIAIIVAIWSKIKLSEDKTDKTWIGFSCLVFILSFMVIGTGNLLFSDYDSYSETEKTSLGVEIIEENDLMCFADVNQTQAQISGSGTYVLMNGSWSMDGDSSEIMYYTYYIKTDDGYKFQKISAEKDNVYIKYCDEGETPHIEVTTEKENVKKVLTKKPSFWTSGIEIFFAYREYDVGDIIVDRTEGISDSKKITFYIPQGSLTTSYDVDMQ